jgi:glyoxylase-like metal-dependent hydrolase (beta-lactamase superfamily II)
MYGTTTTTPRVTIAKVGSLCVETSEVASSLGLQIKEELGIGGGSSVSIINADRTILVDTGFDYEWVNSSDNRKNNARRLTMALKEVDIAPDDVDIVFITHWHRDHFGNLNLFKKAQFMASKLLVKRHGLKNFIGVDDQQNITDGVKVLFTPGHTVDHASIVVETELGPIRVRVAIAGDAIISHSYFREERIWRNNPDFFDDVDARKSVLRVIDNADVIIPGHGVPFLINGSSLESRMPRDSVL